MSELTAAQRNWLAGVQKALNAPGSAGLSFATGGEDVIVYLSTHDDDIDSYRGDPIDIVNENQLHVADLIFPKDVQGWCI